MKEMTLPIKKYLSPKEEVALLELQCDRQKTTKVHSNPSLRRISQRQTTLSERRKLLFS